MDGCTEGQENGAPLAKRAVRAKDRTQRRLGAGDAWFPRRIATKEDNQTDGLIWIKVKIKKAPRRSAGARQGAVSGGDVRFPLSKPDDLSLVISCQSFVDSGRSDFTLHASRTHLAVPERRLWTAIIRENLFDSEAALSILRSTLEAHQRARTCRETVDSEGAIYRDRFGQPKPHPLIAAERDARAHS